MSDLRASYCFDQLSKSCWNSAYRFINFRHFASRLLAPAYTFQTASMPIPLSPSKYDTIFAFKPLNYVKLLLLNSLDVMSRIMQKKWKAWGEVQPLCIAKETWHPLWRLGWCRYVNILWLFPRLSLTDYTTSYRSWSHRNVSMKWLISYMMSMIYLSVNLQFSAHWKSTKRYPICPWILLNGEIAYF